MLENVNVTNATSLISQVVSINLPIVRFQTLNNLSLGEPPILISNPAVTVPSNRCLNPLTNKPSPNGLVHRLKSRVHVRLKHLPARHSWILLLVRMKRMVEFLNIAQVVSYQFIPTIILLVLIRVICRIKHLLRLSPVSPALGIKTTNSQVVLMFNATLLRTIQRFSILLLRVHRRTEAHERE